MARFSVPTPKRVFRALVSEAYIVIVVLLVGGFAWHTSISGDPDQKPRELSGIPGFQATFTNEPAPFNAPGQGHVINIQCPQGRKPSSLPEVSNNRIVTGDNAIQIKGEICQSKQKGKKNSKRKKVKLEGTILNTANNFSATVIQKPFPDQSFVTDLISLKEGKNLIKVSLKYEDKTVQKEYTVEYRKVRPK